jgi:hypothetical protein
MPSAAERGGDFSNILDVSGNLIPVNDRTALTQFPRQRHPEIPPESERPGAHERSAAPQLRQPRHHRRSLPATPRASKSTTRSRITTTSHSASSRISRTASSPMFRTSAFPAGTSRRRSHSTASCKARVSQPRTPNPPGPATRCRITSSGRSPATTMAAGSTTPTTPTTRPCRSPFTVASIAVCSSASRTHSRNISTTAADLSSAPHQGLRLQRRRPDA